MAYETGGTTLTVPPQRLTLEDRSRLTLSGVTEVNRFDDTVVELQTTQGALVVRGSGLNLQTLDLEGGQVVLLGDVEALTFEDLPQGGLLARLFR